MAKAFLLLAATVVPSMVSAQHLAFDAKHKLTEILLHDEFQPRTEKLGVLEQLWQKLKPTIQGYLIAIWDAITGALSATPESVPEWLFNFSSGATGILSWAATLCFVGGILLIIYHLSIPALRTLRRRALISRTRELKASPSYSELLGGGHYRKLLQELRSELRTLVSRAYTSSEATSDRELCLALTANDESELLFKEVSSSFENVAYANKPADKEPLRSLYDRFTKLKVKNL